MATTGCCTRLRVMRTILLRGIGGVACQLARNRGSCTLECAGHCPHTDNSLHHACNCDAALRLELLVIRFFLQVHTLQDRVLHFIFEAATVSFNRNTTNENGRRKLRLWSSRLEWKLFGSCYHRKTPEQRLFFIATPETSGQMEDFHDHQLVHLLPIKHSLFERYAASIWIELNPTGSLNLQPITQTEQDRNRVFGYGLKDAWTIVALGLIVLSTKLSNKHLSDAVESNPPA
jgi:hypothetical protein